jgi:hypothetical protein
VGDGHDARSGGAWLNYVTGGLPDAPRHRHDLPGAPPADAAAARGARARGHRSVCSRSNTGQILTGNWVERFNVVAFTDAHHYRHPPLRAGGRRALLFVDNIMADMPLTTDLSVWWSTRPSDAGLVFGLVGVCLSTPPGAANRCFGQVVPTNATHTRKVLVATK